jgi:hypothetical protein
MAKREREFQYRVPSPTLLLRLKDLKALQAKINMNRQERQEDKDGPKRKEGPKETNREWTQEKKDKKENGTVKTKSQFSSIYPFNKH